MTQASPKKSSVSFRDKFRPLDLNLQQEELAVNKPAASSGFVHKSTFKDNTLDYNTPISLTRDGQTAYYSKRVFVKPNTGIFSKKEPVHKVYRADKVKGEWKTVRELALCPKEFSALHPPVSPDGKRLFFASNMPGTFGEFDIYVATISGNGAMGNARNLGEKVNTDKNDRYPKLIKDNTLVFASEGHRGYGGLDVYSVTVAQKSVGLAVNMGSTINSKQDEYTLQLDAKNGTAYVVSNRKGKTNTDAMIGYTFVSGKKKSNESDFRLLEALNTAGQENYSSSLFEDE